jgi:hypothetical protein
MTRIARWATIVLLAVLGAWLLLTHSGDLLLLLEPGLLVIEVRSPTMVLQQANHRYTVQCDDRCAIFMTGKRHRMRKRGSVLEYRVKGQTIALPILEEQILFPTQPGGLG